MGIQARNIVSGLWTHDNVNTKEEYFMLHYVWYCYSFMTFKSVAFVVIFIAQMVLFIIECRMENQDYEESEESTHMLKPG